MVRYDMLKGRRKTGTHSSSSISYKNKPRNWIITIGIYNIIISNHISLLLIIL